MTPDPYAVCEAITRERAANFFIERRPEEVLVRRVALSTPEKAWAAMRSLALARAAV